MTGWSQGMISIFLALKNRRLSSNDSSFPHAPFLTRNSANHGDASQSGWNAIIFSEYVVAGGRRYEVAGIGAMLDRATYVTGDLQIVTRRGSVER